MNPLLELNKLGQSVWYDSLRKGLVTSGELKRMIEDYAVSGIDSNLAVFERALSGTSEYDEDISGLLNEGLTEQRTFTRLFVKDAKLAADIMAGVYMESGRSEGFVCMDIDPGTAHDAQASLREAERLFSAVNKPNIMVKIPATKEGLKAIEELAFAGRNVAATLLFSIERYEETAWAYIRGLERRLSEGMPVDGVTGAAAFLINRADTFFDRVIGERIEKARSNDEKARLRTISGRVAVANAKMAWLRHQEVFSSERFRMLRDAGARPLKLMWTGTGVKDPAYPDTRYVEELIKEETVNAMPLRAMLAFYDHGKAKLTLTDDIDAAKKVFSTLEDLGIEYSKASEKLEAEGIQALSEAYKGILSSISFKTKALQAKTPPAMSFNLNGFEPPVSEAVEEIESENFLERLWAKDPTLWRTGPDDKKLIKNSLGWVALPELMEDRVQDINGFVREVMDAGFTHAVLLGMGGSSLAPLVFSSTFGPLEGFPRLIVLDSTDPEALRDVESSIDMERTLFIVSSKSGSTIEPLSLFEYFHGKVSKSKGEDAGKSFIAITDPGTPLEGFSRKYRFRRLFTNPKDIGGRFSAISLFGLVPAALMGVDIGKLLAHSGKIDAAIHPCMQSKDNPVLALGAALGAFGKLGMDKLTFFLSKGIESFGMWVEQLVAESTGKEGKGLVPIVNEPPGKPDDYGDDRLFVFISLGEDKALSEAAGRFIANGHPVIEFRLGSLYELGAEFLRWEVATSIAGQILGINPFDQPDVELAKKNTVSRLNQINRPGALNPPGVALNGNDGFRVFFGKNTIEKLDGKKSAGEALGSFLKLAKKGDYFGILAYYNPADEAIGADFARLRKALRDSTKAATQFGYGPRYLHSTGQLHKGGPDSGLFLILCHQPGNDYEVPGSPFSLSQLELSQAFGDMEALDARGMRVALIDLKDPSKESLKEFEDTLKRAATA